MDNFENFIGSELDEFKTSVQIRVDEVERRRQEIENRCIEFGLNLRQFLNDNEQLKKIKSVNPTVGFRFDFGIPAEKMPMVPLTQPRAFEFDFDCQFDLMEKDLDEVQKNIIKNLFDNRITKEEAIKALNRTFIGIPFPTESLIEYCLLFKKYPLLKNIPDLLYFNHEWNGYNTTDIFKYVQKGFGIIKLKYNGIEHNYILEMNDGSVRNKYHKGYVIKFTHE